MKMGYTQTRPSFSVYISVMLLKDVQLPPRRTLETCSKT